MTYQDIQFELADGIARLTLNRPDKLNALDSQLFRTLEKHLEELEQREDIHVVVLSGAGKSFCAGHDVAVLGAEGQDENLNARVIARLADIDKAVVVVIHGHCYTGGLELALAGDIIIVSENAKIGEKTIFEGAYTIAFEHNYPGATEGSYHNISENFAVVEYTVADENKSEVILETAANGLKVSYKIDKAGRIASVGRGLVLIESVNDPFPAGTVVKANNAVYPVSTDSGKIAVSIPLSKSGELIEEGSIELEFLNYYGSAILETPVRAVLYPSYDGLHITTGSNPDAESDAVNFALEALDSYAIAVTGADGKKPVYEFESAAKAETMLLTVNALCNADTAQKVTLTLQNAKEDYAEVPLSTLFVGYDDVDSEGIEIVVGACSMKLKESAPNGEYRMAFTVGDKTEYVKITIGK